MATVTNLPTAEEVRQYLGIDYDDDPVVNANVQRALSSAVAYLHGAVGEGVEDVLAGDARVKELILAYSDEFYSERGASAKAANATCAHIASVELQLRLEFRRAQEANA